MTSSKALTRTYFTFCRALLLFTAALPGTLRAQGSDEVRSVQNIFTPVGPPAEILKQTAVLVLLICLVIFVVVGGLLFYAVVRYRRRSTDDDTTEPPQVYGSTAIELAWTVPPILIVVVLALVTARTIGEIQQPKFAGDPLALRIVGHRFWWELQYPKYKIITANEIHVPVSYLSTPRPVEMTLASADVVHGFWVPELNGKQWLVPDRENKWWIQPTALGTYLGNCTVLCGPQHANMLIRVVVESPEDFEKWATRQQQPANSDPKTEEGRKAFGANSCGSCHTIDGTSSNGIFGPNLTHFMTRKTLGSGVAPNDEANLKSWLRNPQELKPGCEMPDMKLSPMQVDQILAYLRTLN
ncbi:MAG: cytochrome c oxidase subunit II [Verrucomicrobia bacterium]|nr:cytochrome c oxidase subunit II [Verrucomicrobiota bacterium]